MKRKTTSEKAGLRILSGFFNNTRKGIYLYTNAGAISKSLLFLDPVREVVCRNPSGISRALDEAEKLSNEGFYLAGYVSYEAGGKPLSAVLKRNKPGAALLYFGAFRKPLIFEGDTSQGLGPLSGGIDLKPFVSKKEYLKNFSLLKSRIKNGDVYQVNYTFQMKGACRAGLENVFYGLCGRQKTPYTAFIRGGNCVIMSFSPELFFEKEGALMSMKPMKGTLLKPCTSREVKAFKKDPKTSAENIMIVDLVRNDLGRICATNSIRAGNLFKVEEYGSLYQMTTKVTGLLKPKTALREIFGALFPSGSVTGAPKKMAMELIEKLEKGERGVYTGAIGYISPGMKKAVFNIPIRTLVIDPASRRAAYGTGSGIVHDSKGASEYLECIGKTGFLKAHKGPEALVESLLLKGKKYYLAGQHLKRLRASADWFGIKPDFSGIKAALKKEMEKNTAKTARKVRVLVRADGSWAVESSAIVPARGGERKVIVSRLKTDSANPYLYHKTTFRGIYDSEYKKYFSRGYYEVIFMNEKGHLTEAHSSNLIIEKNGRYFTPPVSCGLLNGTYRQRLMQGRGFKLEEKVLYLADLKKAGAIYLCNSVRGLRRVTL